MNPNPQPLETTLPSGIELSLFRAPGLQPSLFGAAGHTDQQSGGFLIGDMEANIRLCVAEKTKKVAAYRHRYAKWWLVMPDYISYGLTDFEQKTFRDQVSIEHDFDKVVLLKPRDASRAFEI